MKTIILLLLSSFGFYSTSPDKNPNSNEGTAEVKVAINNIKEAKGSIVVIIYDNPRTFLEEGAGFKKVRQKVLGKTIEITLSDIPKGTYAISLYHDVNSDKVCNKNFLGVPVEPYGFSNGFNNSMAKPSFNECKITVNKNSTFKVDLIH